MALLQRLRGAVGRSTSVCRWLSYVRQGTQYELDVVASLASLGFVIRKTGKALDGGVDFEDSIQVIGQCKDESSQCSARTVRELEGSFLHYEERRMKESGGAHAVGQPVKLLAMLVSSAGFTKDAHEHTASARIPLILCHAQKRLLVPSALSSSGNLSSLSSLAPSSPSPAPLTISQFIMNPAAQRLAPNVLVAHRHARGHKSVTVVHRSAVYKNEA